MNLDIFEALTQDESFAGNRWHVFAMRRLNSLSRIREMWGPVAVEWYFWRFVYDGAAQVRAETKR